MSLTIILVLLLLPLVFLEVILNKSDRSQKWLYQIAFLVVFFVVIIKYYYGPDIKLYVPLYDEVINMSIFDSQYFEPGFLLYLKGCKLLHLSFWWMTAIISTFYFTMLWCLFRKIPKYRVFALLIIVALDYNLLFYELRQCLAVSFFVLAYLLYDKKRIVLSLLCLFCMSFCHKSGIFIAMLFLLAMILPKFKVSSYSYAVVTVMMLLLVVVPIEKGILLLLEYLPLSSAVDSIKHHLLESDAFQLIYIVYFLLAVVLYFIAKQNSRAFDARLIFMMFIMVAIFVKYWFLLNRIRSYFIPIFIYYILTNTEIVKGFRVIKPITYAYLMLYILYTMCSFHLSVSVRSKSKVGNARTVFALFSNTKTEIISESMRVADMFWRYEYLK